MTLTIDADRCQGHGRCALISMDLFDVDDAGNGIVLQAHPGPEHADDVQQAIGSCPEQAIANS